MAALIVAKNRSHMQEAQGKAKELRDLEPGSTTNQQAFVKLVEMATLVRQIKSSPEDIPDEEQRGMWVQRGGWLHDELMALAAERFQGEDGQNFWANIALLLYAAADSVKAAGGKQAQLEADLAAALARAERAEDAVADAEEESRTALEAMETRAKDAEAARDAATSALERAGGAAGMETGLQRAASGPSLSNLPPAAGLPSPAAAAAGGEGAPGSGPTGPPSSETLEMRTKLVLQQQEIQRRVADSRELMQRLESVSAENDRLKKQIEETSEEARRKFEEYERQKQVITSLMERSESTTREVQRIQAERDLTVADNKAVHQSVVAQSEVIEKLIELNNDLTDKVNTSAATFEYNRTNGGGASTPGGAVGGSPGGAVATPPPPGPPAPYPATMRPPAPPLAPSNGSSPATAPAPANGTPQAVSNGDPLSYGIPGLKPLGGVEGGTPAPEPAEDDLWERKAAEKIKKNAWKVMSFIAGTDEAAVNQPGNGNV